MKMPLAFCLQRPTVDAMSLRQLALFPMAKKAKRQKTQVLSARVGGSLGIKHGAMVSLLLDTVSRIDASDFFAEVARIRKASE